MKPGSSADGTVVVDFFVGEAAVVAHVIEAGLLVTKDEAAANDKSHENQIHSEEEVGDQCEGQAREDALQDESLVRASQINTNVELSQHTMDAFLGS
ncbi:hypothetical protein PInf_009846 [Phytophthora infestans]|nr:hypothetical protein PInf_009846 [Phytophthora infestans]